MSLSFYDPCRCGNTDYPTILAAAEHLLQEHPTAYPTVSAAAKAIINSVVNETPTRDGAVWERIPLPLPIAGHLMEEQLPVAAQQSTSSPIAPFPIADYIAKVDAALAEAEKRFCNNYFTLARDLLQSHKLVEEKRELRPTRTTVARTIPLPRFPYTFMARPAGTETWVEYGSLFNFLDSIYATLRQQDLHTLLRDNTLFNHDIRMNDEQRAILEAYYELWK